MYTPFAATGLGLGAIAIISLLDCWECLKARREKEAEAVVQDIPPDAGNIQIGTYTS